MKVPVKTRVLLSIFSVLQLTTFAQLKLPVANPIANDIKKVVEDYPNQFRNLMGDLIIKNPQSTEYQCNFKMNAAEEATIMKYSSGSGDVCSWQALILTTESFEKAKQKFKSLYSQLHNLGVRPGGSKSYPLKGSWEQPVEQKNFTAIVFAPGPADEELIKKLRVELSMQYELLEWKVRILVYNKEREDEERGKIVE